MARGVFKISDSISLPRDAVTQTFAYIGRKGSGKTYLATMVAEQMLDEKAQTVAIDPVGNWWGLRVGADGKTKGKEIFVIGGEHGDVPLVPEAGARIAQLIVEKGISAVIDVSTFRLGERKRFCADFGEELLQLKKKHRTPLHLYLEEAQLIVPQRVGPEEARMVGAFEQIVRLGRNYGIGCSLITQRPQSVNKEVLSQVECLCVLQVTGLHERKALEDWVQEAGADRKLVGELPGLGRGEGYVWSPSWLRVYKRVHFASKTTFDASATPEVGKKTKAASLSAVDVERLKTDIADVVAKAEKDNPVALRKRIVELERELAKKGNVSDKPMGVSQWMEYGRKYGYATFFEKQMGESFESKTATMRAALVKASVTLKKIQEIATSEAMLKEIEQFQDATSVPRRRIELNGPKAKVEIKKVEYRDVEPKDGKKWGPGEKKILTAIAQHTQGITREHITVLTGYKSSSRNEYVRRLVGEGLVRQDGELFFATDAGVAELGPDYRPLPTSGPELVEHVMKTLPPGEAKILQVLIENPGGLEREVITELTDYKSSSRNEYIRRLGARKLVEVAGSTVRAADILL